MCYSSTVFYVRNCLEYGILLLYNVLQVNIFSGTLHQGDLRIMNGCGHISVNIIFYVYVMANCKCTIFLMYVLGTM